MSRCHCGGNELYKDCEFNKKVLLVGNPNVGKSVIFTHLTGIEVGSANYTGTTVSFTHGIVRFDKKEALLIDVPGVYSLNPFSVAEKVATDIIDEGADLIIYVLDATHLERNLHLALEIQKFNIPIVYVLNLLDVASRRGLKIDVEKLEELLNHKVFKTVAVKKEGILELKEEIFLDHESKNNEVIDNVVVRSKEICDQVLTKEKVKVSFLEKLGDASVKPFPGIPMAIFIMIFMIVFVVFGGKGLRAGVFTPLINNTWTPFVTWLVDLVIPTGGFWDNIRNILLGSDTNQIGFLIKGIEWPIGMILPYVFLFYVAIGFLEDSGYLPRLGVLLDGLFKKVGLPGTNIVPFMLGYGCAVPAIFATRTASSKKERLIAVTLICFAVPCVSQTGAFLSLVGSRSMVAVLFVYMISFAFMIVAGLIMNKIIKGKPKPVIVEIPNILIPNQKTLWKKVYTRTKNFLFEAELPMIIGIFVASIIAESGLLNYITPAIKPIVVDWLGLPADYTLNLLLGVVRRELLVIPVTDNLVNMNLIQLITSSVVGLFYLPCIAVLGVLAKEFNYKTAIVITLSTFVFAIFFGGIINHMLIFIFNIFGIAV